MQNHALNQTFSHTIEEPDEIQEIDLAQIDLAVLTQALKR